MFKKYFLIILCCYSINAVAADTFINDTVKQFTESNAIPSVTVVMYVAGQPQTYYFGRAKSNTLFELGSMMNLMTSLLLAQQVDCAKVQLDADITDYIADLPDAFAGINLQNLATATAGLPFMFSDPVRAHWQPSERVDEDWRPSKIGMLLLNDALKKITDKKIGQLYQQQIKKPLKMTSPGSLTSANDMQRFLAAAIGLPGTSERLFYQMRMTQAAYIKLSDRKQGLGWEIHSLPADNKIKSFDKVTEIYERAKFDGDALIDKVGAAKGYRSYIAVMPNKKSGIVVLLNKSIPKEKVVALGRTILSHTVSHA